MCVGKGGRYEWEAVVGGPGVWWCGKEFYRKEERREEDMEGCLDGEMEGRR